MKRPHHKKQDKLFTELLEIASNLKEGGSYFLSMMEKHDLDNSEFQIGISNIEGQGDDLVHKITSDLNNTFITPIEREDALSLADSMDEILDGMEDFAEHMYMFNINFTTVEMVEISRNINKAVDEIYEAVLLLSEKKLADIKEYIIKISTLEGENDFIVRRAIKELFDEHKDDAVRLIQVYEVYKILERTTNSCHHVGKVLDTVVMKNA